MQFIKNTSSGKASIIGLVIKSIIGLGVILGIIFFLSTIDFLHLKKKLKKLFQMKILKLLNKKIFLTQLVCLIFFTPAFAEEKPIDIWNIEKKDNQVISETNISNENTVNTNQNSVYELQTNKQTDTIKLDKEFSSKEIKIVGLYDPSEYGLSMDMWSNSDGTKLKNLFQNINKFNLSEDASDIMHISLLTNAYSPTQNITEQEFMSFKSDWLIKDANLELIEEYLIKNQIINK